jgi:hypothetical protein
MTNNLYTHKSVFRILSSTIHSHTFAVLLKHPLFITVITFILTGILATNYQNILAESAKKRDIEVSTRQRTADAVKTITDILYERAVRGSMVVSSLRRHAPIDELRERKKAYDDVFIRYNSEMQSNLFRIREMFGTTDYTDFNALMEGALHEPLTAQDSCITNAYDDAIASEDDKRKLADEVLQHCKIQLHPGHSNFAELKNERAFGVIAQLSI